MIIKALLTSIHVLISIMLVVIILLQASKGGGLAGSAFGGQASSTLFGPRGTASVLSSITQYLAGAFLVLSLVLSFMAGAGQMTESVTQKVLSQSPAAQLPAVESLDFSSSPTDAEIEESEPVDFGADTEEP